MSKLTGRSFRDALHSLHNPLTPYKPWSDPPCSHVSMLVVVSARKLICIGNTSGRLSHIQGPTGKHSRKLKDPCLDRKDASMVARTSMLTGGLYVDCGLERREIRSPTTLYGKIICFCLQPPTEFLEYLQRGLSGHVDISQKCHSDRKVVISGSNRRDEAGGI